MNTEIIKITANHFDVLVKSTENQTDNFHVILQLLPSITVRFTQNICVDMCLANGTPDEIRVCYCKSGTTFKKSKLFDDEFLFAFDLPNAVHLNVPLL